MLIAVMVATQSHAPRNVYLVTFRPGVTAVTGGRVAGRHCRHWGGRLVGYGQSQPKAPAVTSE